MSNIAQRAFKRWVSERGKRKAAAILGVSPTAILDWTHGRSCPDPRHRRDVERVVGIPVDQWDMADGVVVGTTIPPPVEPTLVSVVAETGDMSAKGKALAHMQNLERRVRDAGNLGVRERALLDAAYSKAIAVYGRLSGELELTTAQILRSPAWGKICNTLVGAVEEWPAAAEAIAAALEALEAPAKVDDETP